MARSALLLVVAVAAVGAAPRAAAGDYYVDVVGGNNANAGTSPGQAWKTITHAVASTPQAGSHTIHVAPGLYDLAVGETFPIDLRPALAIVGDAGSALTTVKGNGGVEPLFRCLSSQQGAGYWFQRDTLLAGLSLRDSAAGVALLSNWNPVDPTLRDLDIRGMDAEGVWLFTNGMQAGSANPRLESVCVTECVGGLDVDAFGISTRLEALGCSFSDNAAGVRIAAGRSAYLTFERCQLDGNAADGVHASYINFGFIDAAFSLCSLSANGLDGFNGVLSPGLGNGLNATFERCTIARNGGVGVRSVENAPHQNHHSDLASSIVFGNADDLLHNGTVTARYCDIGDGDFRGQNGNFSADPQFVDAPGGDFRLRVGSPCVDAGDLTQQDPDCTPIEVGAYPLLSPRSYCTAKANSCGTLPMLSAVGTPSASATSGFVVRAVNTKAGKFGLLIYTDAGPALPAPPFLGGVLCLASPVRRAIAVPDTTGTPGRCDGVLALDLNAFAAGALGGNPLPSLRVAGTTVDVQFWGRDLPGNSLLSDALEVVLCP